MGINIRVVILLALLACLGSSAYANTYTGTILETITSTSDPGFSVGETAIGSYEYISQTTDGTFGCLYLLMHSLASACTPDMDGFLSGHIILFGESSFSNGPANITQSNTAHLQVTDGQVSAFVTQGQIGGGGYTFLGFTFSIQDAFPGLYNYQTSGTLSFSGPALLKESNDAVDAPEASSLPLLAMGLTGIAIIKRRSIIGLLPTSRAFSSLKRRS